MLGRVWQRVPPWLADGLVALLFVAIGQAELHMTVDDGYQAGPIWLNMPLVLLMTAPLAFRRRAPEAVFVVMAAAMCLPSVVVAHTVFFWGSLVPLAVATFTVARHRDGVAARYAWAVAVLLLATGALHVAELRTLSNIFFALGLYVAAWGAGRLLRQYARQREHLADALERLAAEQVRREGAAASAERRRIAAEMHDVVAHAVSLMVLQLGAARMRLEVDGVQLPPGLRAAEDTGREALGELRRTVGVLREPWPAGTLRPVPDLDALHDLVRRFGAVGLAVTLEVTPGDGALPPSLQLAAYRIVQEGLTNVVKHAGGVDVSVSVRRVGFELVVAVRNAPGRASDVPIGGHGLAGMRERAAMFGGSLEAGPERNGSFRLVARLPVPADRRPAREGSSPLAVP